MLSPEHVEKVKKIIDESLQQPDLLELATFWFRSGSLSAQGIYALSWLNWPEVAFQRFAKDNHNLPDEFYYSYDQFFSALYDICDYPTAVPGIARHLADRIIYH